VTPRTLSARKKSSRVTANWSNAIPPISAWHVSASKIQAGLLALTLSTQTWADYKDGVAAYRRGDYTTA
jgi:hypothetical protein